MGYILRYRGQKAPQNRPIVPANLKMCAEDGKKWDTTPPTPPPPSASTLALPAIWSLIGSVDQRRKKTDPKLWNRSKKCTLGYFWIAIFPCSVEWPFSLPKRWSLNYNNWRIAFACHAGPRVQFRLAETQFSIGASAPGRWDWGLMAVPIEMGNFTVDIPIDWFERCLYLT